jgi:hypothetical protein
MAAVKFPQTMAEVTPQAGYMATSFPPPKPWADLR